MQDGEYHLNRRNARLMIDSHGNAAAIVRYRHGIIRIDDHLNGITVAGQGLVNRIVHDLINQMVKASAGGRSDVHARPFPNSLQALQNLDLVCAIFAVALCIFSIKCTHSFLHFRQPEKRSEGPFSRK